MFLRLPPGQSRTTRFPVVRVAVSRRLSCLPLIYCLEQTGNEADIDQIVLPLTSPLAGNLDENLFGGLYAISGEGIRRDTPPWGEQLYRPLPDGARGTTQVTAIPYAYWGNRGPSKMRVWIDIAP